jgi:primosomal protein N' (replication factor Y)
LGLAGGDPRAAERTFQLLQQVAGRSGRAEDKGTVFLQTTAPDHPVMKALCKGDSGSFLEAEMRERKNYRLPPFGRLASLVVSGTDASAVCAAANKLAASAPREQGLRLLGPAPAPFSVLRGRTRYRLLLQSERNAPLSGLVDRWLKATPLPRALRVQVDIDPYSFL